MERQGIPEAGSGRPIGELGRGLQEVESLLDHLVQLCKEGNAVQSWVKRLLKHSVVAYSQLSVGPDYPSDFLCTLFRSIPSIPRFASDVGDLLQTTLRSHVLKLYSTWQLPDDDFSYLLEILRSVSLLGAKRENDERVYGKMLSAIQQNEYRGCAVSGESLEVALIRTVFGMSGDDPEHAEIARNYVARTELSPLCFRKLWELKHTDMLDHIVTLVDCSLAEPRIGLEGTLAKYYMSSEDAFDRLFNSFPELLGKLLTQDGIRTDVPAQDSRWMRYQSATQNIGVDISVDRPTDVHPDLPLIRMEFAPVYTIQWQPLGRGVLRRKSDSLSLNLDLRLQAEEARCRTSRVIERNRFSYNPPDHSVTPIQKTLEYLAQSLPQIGEERYGIM